MARKRYPPNDPREWLNRAWSNLLRAKRIVRGVYLEDLCFDAQQAAEKAIKAVFVHHGVSFPYIHNVARLLELLEQNGLTIPKYIKKAAKLTRFAVEPRYPGLSGAVTEREHRSAVRMAEAVWSWAHRHILGRP